MDGALYMIKKKNLLDTIYHFFLKKYSYQWLKLMSCGYTCREQILHRK